MLGPFLVQLVVANLPWIVLSSLGRNFAYPFSRIDEAFRLFPKLQSEYETLTDVYSAEIAERLVLAYSNTFLMNLLCFLILLILFMISRLLMTSGSGDSPDEGAVYSVGQRVKGYQINQKEVAKLIFFLFVATVFVFFLPISYHPSKHVGHDRLINSMYSGFVFFFLLFFLFAQLLILHLLGPKRR